MTALEVPAGIELRPYQVEALERIEAAEARGVRKQLGVAATGLGKTIMFCALAKRREGRTLILAHRDELVTQAAAKVAEVWPDVDVGIVKADRDDVGAEVVVASVQTLSRGKRLARLVAVTNPDTAGMAGWGMRRCEPFSLVVVDEAHHTAADSYRKILEALRAGEPERIATPEEVDAGCELGIVPEGPLLLGVTATPDRGDGKGLDDLFDEITFSFDILWGIRSGYLCDVRGIRVELSNLDLSGVKVARGDYEAGAAGHAMQAAHAPEFIYEAWHKHASERRTLVFVPTVALSIEVADHFKAKGVACAHLDGATELEERRSILRRYASGELQVVSNCMVLTEGFDSPRTDCIIQARPTKSRALFTQIVGRGTRKHPEKQDLLVLDVVGSSSELSLITIPSLFGLEKRFRERMGDGTATLSDTVQERDDWLVKQGQMRAEDADLFRSMRDTGIAWVQVHVDGELRRFERSLGYRLPDGQYVKLPTAVLTQKRDGDDDSWLVGLIHPDKRKQVLMADVALELAQGIGEDYVRKALGDKTSFIDADAAWRKKAPSPKARGLAQRLRIDAKKYKTAGELSDAIDARLARNQQKKGKK